MVIWELAGGTESYDYKEEQFDYEEIRCLSVDGFSCLQMCKLQTGDAILMNPLTIEG